MSAAAMLAGAVVGSPFFGPPEMGVQSTGVDTLSHPYFDALRLPSRSHAVPNSFGVL